MYDKKTVDEIKGIISQEANEVTEKLKEITKKRGKELIEYHGRMFYREDFEEALRTAGGMFSRINKRIDEAVGGETMDLSAVGAVVDGSKMLSDYLERTFPQEYQLGLKNNKTPELIVCEILDSLIRKEKTTKAEDLDKKKNAKDR